MYVGFALGVCLACFALGLCKSNGPARHCPLLSNSESISGTREDYNYTYDHNNKHEVSSSGDSHKRSVGEGVRAAWSLISGLSHLATPPPPASPVQYRSRGR